MEVGFSLVLVVLAGVSQLLLPYASSLEDDFRNSSWSWMLYQSQKALRTNADGTTCLSEGWCCQPELRQESVWKSYWHSLMAQSAIRCLVTATISTLTLTQAYITTPSNTQAVPSRNAKVLAWLESVHPRLKFLKPTRLLTTAALLNLQLGLQSDFYMTCKERVKLQYKCITIYKLLRKSFGCGNSNYIWIIRHAF